MFAVALAACDGGISDPGAAPDAGVVAPDATARPDGGAAAAGCASVVEAGAAIDRGRVGWMGGSKAPILGCTDVFGERVVGLAVQMSDGTTVFGGRSAQGIRVACAKVDIAADGTAQVGTVTTHDVSGDGGYSWSPSTWSPTSMCQPGWVVSGVLSHLGTSNNRFIDVTITCSELLRDGGTGQTATKHVTGSLGDTANPMSVQCKPNEILTQLGPWTGAGLDAVNVYCAPAACGQR